MSLKNKFIVCLLLAATSLFAQDTTSPKDDSAKQKALAKLADSLRPFFQDMALERDTAFMVSLKQHGKNPVKEYQAQWKAVKCKSKKEMGVRGETTTDTVSIDSVWVNFSHYVIATIRVYAHDASGPLTFINTNPLSIASQSSIARTKNTVLAEEVRRKRNDQIKYLRFSDILSIDPGKGDFITDYTPKDVSILLDQKHILMPVKKPSVASSFRINAFSDLNGFVQDNAPNGKLQTEALCIIPMVTKPFNRTGITFFKDILPEICISKLGDDNRLLTVNVDTSSKIKYVNHFDMLQHVNFWGGMRVNVMTIDSRNTNSTFYFNFRTRFMRTQLADTLFNGKRLFNALSVYYEFEFYYKRSLSKLFSIDLSLSAGVLKLFDNTLRLSYGPHYDDYKSMNYQPGFTMHPNTFQFFKSMRKTSAMFVYTPQMILKYKLRKNQQKAIFLRMSFPNSFSVNNGYMMAEVGFSSPITSAVK